MFTSFDTRDVPVLRRVRGKLAMYNLHVHEIAARHGCRLVDLWSMRSLLDPRAWAEDRLHLSAEGHRRLALAVCEELGLPVAADWREPWPAVPRRRLADLAPQRPAVGAGVPRAVDPAAPARPVVRRRRRRQATGPAPAVTVSRA